MLPCGAAAMAAFHGDHVVRMRVHAWGSGFDDLADHVWAMMDKMGGGHIFRSHSPRSWRPRLNIYETPEEYVVCVELAGMPREAIDVCAEAGVLHIRGVRQRPVIPTPCERQADSVPSGETPNLGTADRPVSVHLMEIDSGRFHRKVPIPGDALVDDIGATYRHGYLWIILPRAGR